MRAFRKRCQTFTIKQISTIWDSVVTKVNCGCKQRRSKGNRRRKITCRPSRNWNSPRDRLLYWLTLRFVRDKHFGDSWKLAHWRLHICNHVCCPKRILSASNLLEHTLYHDLYMPLLERPFSITANNSRNLESRRQLDHHCLHFFLLVFVLSKCWGLDEHVGPLPWPIEILESLSGDIMTRSENCLRFSAIWISPREWWYSFWQRTLLSPALCLAEFQYLLLQTIHWVIFLLHWSIGQWYKFIEVKTWLLW